MHMLKFQVKNEPKTANYKFPKILKHPNLRYPILGGKKGEHTRKKKKSTIFLKLKL